LKPYATSGDVYIANIHFTARPICIAQHMLQLSVRPSICPYVRHKSEFYQNDYDQNWYARESRPTRCRCDTCV